MAAALSPFLPYLAGALLLLLILVIAVTMVALHRVRHPAPRPAADAPNAREFRAARRSLRAARRSLRAGLQRLAGVEAVPDHPYTVPWIALLGPPDAGIAGFHAAIDPAEPGDPAANTLVGAHWTIRFCRDGALIETEERLLATESWRGRLERLVRLLRAERPTRPLDGLVVAIPASWLAGRDALPADRLTAEGTQLYEAVWALQRATALRVPLYLVIAGGERLDGFAGLVAALDADARREMLGWPVPYGLDALFRPEWIDEAIDRLVAGLGALQMQAFAAGDPPDPAALLLLPQALAETAGRLRSLATALLRPSVYHEPFLFRGVYVAGRDAAGAPVFLQRLLTDLVFREYRLARPARGVVTRRGRQIQTLRRAVIGFAGLTVLCVVLLEWAMPVRRDALAPVMADLQEVVRTRDNGAAGGANTVSRALTGRLLNSLAQLDVTHLWSAAAPTSYLENPNRRISDAIAVGYNAAVLAAIRDGLDAKPAALLPAPESGDCGAAPSTVGAGGTGISALGAWRDAVAAMVALDHETQIYRILNQSQSVDALAELSHYALSLDMPPDFNTNADLYRAALGRARLPPLHVDDEQAKAETGKRLEAVFQAAAAEQFGLGRLDVAAARVRFEIKALQAAGAGIDPEEALNRLKSLRMALADLAAAAGAVSASSAIGPGLADPLDRLAGLSILPANLGNRLRQTGSACRDAAVDRAKAQSADQSNPLLAIGDKGFGLSGGFKALSAALDTLLGEPFMQAPATPMDLVLPQHDVLWDDGVLRDALAAVGSYQTLQGQSLPGVPPELKQAIKAALRLQIGAYVADRLHAAAGRGDSAGGLSEDRRAARRTEIRNFAAAAPLLGELRDALDIAGLTGIAGQIGTAAGDQADRLLGAVDQALREANLYVPLDPGFRGWDGTPPLAARSFGAANAGELTALLAGQRGFVSDLAQAEAQPLVSFLSDSQKLTLHHDTAAANRWSGILDALARYDRKAPDSSLAVLERFIAADMDQIALGKCATALAAILPAADYFGERLAALKYSLGQRCETLERDRLRQGYGSLANLFNTTLAGHFPFALDAGNGPLAVEADPGDIRRFYSEFDTIEADPLQPRLRALLGAAGTGAADFLDQLAAARQVLQPILGDAPVDAPLTLEADVDFRPDPALEAAGDQVLEWSIEAGDERLSSLDVKHVLDWSYGQPLKILLRWARNAPQMPVPNDGAAAPKTREVMAAWSYTDPWALLAFLHQQDAARDPAVPAPARKPETVLMTMPLQRNPAAAAGGAPVASDVARLFLRLRLAAIIRLPGQPDRRVAVTLPAFPAAAPVL
jgi:type VI secretion system protein ImpL